MTVVFTLLFFAALIGIFRPYKFIPQSKRWHYGLASFLLFLGIGITAPTVEQPETAAATSTFATTTAPGSGQAEAKAEPVVPSKWMYDRSRDEMRGGERRYATLQSENSIDFDFPYGEQPGVITVRQDPEHGLDVMFSLPSGQILCHSFVNSYINAKFDDGPIRRFNCTDSSDGSSEVAFMTDPRTFLAALKKAERTVIEAEFFQAGRQQYVFDTRNLEWE